MNELLEVLVKHYESLHDGNLKQIGLQPKMCPAGYWTAGYGRVICTPKGVMLKGEENEVLACKYNKISTVEDAIKALREDLAVRISMVDSLKLTLNDGEKAALVSFTYNVGFANLKKSTLLKLVKLHAPAGEIDKAFRMWNKAGDEVLAGLTFRRTSEAFLYIFGKNKFYN